MCWYVVLLAGLPVHCCDNTPLGEMTKKKKTVLEILEVIVHSLLTPLFWGCSVAQRCSPHGGWEAEEGRHKGVRA